MTWDQLRQLRDAGFEIGSHTRTHPYLTKIADAGALEHEVAGSRGLLERQLAVRVRFFAYPFGLHSADVESAVKAAGYTAARGFPGGAWNDAGRIWTLRSVPVTESMASFRRAVAALAKS